MLNLNRDYIANFIQKAREYHVKEYADIEQDSSNATDDGAHSVLAFNAEDVSYDE